jgi:hypothetical protein
MATLTPALEADDRVLGLLVGGSRGKGFATDASDWDVYLVLSDDVPVEDVLAGLDLTESRLDLCGALTLDEFVAYAEVGSPDEWKRYYVAHLKPTFDRTGGTLQQLCDDKEFLPSDLARARAEALLDGYVNSYYRSLKNARDANMLASGLDAAESVTHLVALAFTAERRVPPYNKFLAWELAGHPLRGDWWPRSEPTQGLLDIVRSGDLDLQASHFLRVEEQARELGYGGVLDAWGQGSLRALRAGRI